MNSIEATPLKSSGVPSLSGAAEWSEKIAAVDLALDGDFWLEEERVEPPAKRDSVETSELSSVDFWSAD